MQLLKNIENFIADFPGTQYKRRSYVLRFDMAYRYAKK